MALDLTCGMAPWLAYLDPGAGSLALQAVIAFVLGGLVTVKLFWRRLRDTASHLFRRGNHDRDPLP